MIAYLGALVTSLTALVLLDRRYRLIFWADARRGGVVLVTATVFFLTWDLAAIGAGFYERGDSPALTGVMLAPELPLEELFFVVFLAYLTLVLRRLLAVAPRTGGGTRGEGAEPAASSHHEEQR